MHKLIGIITRTIFAGCLICMIAVVCLLYWLQAAPRSIDHIQPFIIRYLTKDKPLTIASEGGTAFFDTARRTISISFRGTRLTYKDARGVATHADISLLSVDIPVTPGATSWLRPVVSLHHAVLYPPKPPQGPPPSYSARNSKASWHSMLRFLDQGGLAFVTHVVMDRAALLQRFGRLCINGMRIDADPATAIDERPYIPLMCVHKRHSIVGKTSIFMTVGLDADIDALQADIQLQWYQSPNTPAGLEALISGVKAAQLRRLPFMDNILDALPADIQDIDASVRMSADADGRLDDIRINMNNVTATIPEGNGKQRPLHIRLRDVHAACDAYCTHFTMQNGVVSLREWNVDVNVKADVRAGSVTLETLSRQPELFNGNVAATFSGADLKDIYKVADRLGYKALRSRFSTYLTAGRLEGGTVTLSFPDAIKEDTPADAVTAGLRFSDAVIHAPQHRITLRGIDGSADYWDRTVTADISGGKGNGYSLRPTQITADIRQNLVTLQGGFNGSMKQLAPMVPQAVKDRSRALRYLLQHGQADASADFSASVPLNKNTSNAPKRHIAANVTFRRTILPSLFPFTDVTGGDFQANIVARQHTKVTGTGKLRRRSKRSALDNAPLVPLPEKLIRVGEGGSAAITLELSPTTKNGQRANIISLNVDAANTTVEVPLGTYLKPSGDAAAFTLKGIGIPGRLETSAMQYKSGDTMITSDSAVFSRSHTMLSVTDMRMSGHNTGFLFQKTTPKQATLAVTGRIIRENALRNGLAAMKAVPSQKKGLKRLDITVDLEEFAAERIVNTMVKNVRGSLTCMNGYCGTIRLKATAATHTDIQFNLTPDTSAFRTGVMAFKAEPAEHLIALLAPNIHIKGGRTDINGTLRHNNTVGFTSNGTFLLRDARLKKMPALSKLLAAASLRGVGDFLTGESGLALDKLTASYRYHDHILNLKDARTSGAALGLTADGTLDFRNKTIALEGVIIPAQGGLNKVVSHIPILGDILTGGKDKGILSANYSVSGALRAPVFSVNPLSLLTPGIFRNLFPSSAETTSGQAAPPPFLQHR